MISKTILLTDNISTTGQLVAALSKLPPDTAIAPFGSPDSKLIYREYEGRAYLDEDFSDFYEEDEEANDKSCENCRYYFQSPDDGCCYCRYDFTDDKPPCEEE